MNRMRSIPQQTAISPAKKQKFCLLKDNTTEISNVSTNYSEDEAALIHNESHQITIVPNGMSHMEKLCDDCLLSIMSYLTLFDVISLCKTSTRMQSAGQIYYKFKFNKFSFGWSQRDWSINEENLPVILEAIGVHICTIDWNYLTTAQFELLVKHCPNVTDLKLSCVMIEEIATLDRNKDFVVNLEKLYIAVSEDILDDDIRYMISGEKLKTLHLKCCSKVRGTFFSNINLVNLKTVEIVNCPELEKNIVNLPEWKGKLTSFTSNTTSFCKKFLALPTEKLERVTELQLDITGFNSITVEINVSGLKKLMKLTLLNNSRRYKFIDANYMISELIEIDSLESLSIYAIKIDRNTLQSLGSLKNLKYLELNSIKNRIGLNMYEDIGKYLSRLRSLSIYNAREYTIMGRPIFNMIAKMPMLHYFSHSSIGWNWLEGIGQTRSITALNRKKEPLKIGVTRYIFNNPKKKAFEAAHNGEITLCIHL